MSEAVAISVTALIFILTVLGGTMVFRKQSRIRKRLSSISEEDKSFTSKHSPEKSGSVNRRFYDSISGGKIQKKIADELSLAAVPLRSEEFLLLWVLVTVAPAALAALFGFHPYVCVSLVLIGGFAVPFSVRKAKRRRMILFNAQLGDALSVMGNCLKAGFSLHQSMESIAREMPDPVAKEFTRLLREIRWGVSMEKALADMAARIRNDDLDLIVSAILIQRQTGGNLSEILETISNTIKERIKIKNDVRVLTANARTSGLIVGLLPVLILVLLMLVNPDYVSMFFTTTAGTAMLITAAILETVGFLIVRKIVSVTF